MSVFEPLAQCIPHLCSLELVASGILGVFVHLNVTPFCIVTLEHSSGNIDIDSALCSVHLNAVSALSHDSATGNAVVHVLSGHNICAPAGARIVP